jgi:hypothetical protein
VFFCKHVTHGMSIYTKAVKCRPLCSQTTRGHTLHLLLSVDYDLHPPSTGISQFHAYASPFHLPYQRVLNRYARRHHIFKHLMLSLYLFFK